MSFPATDAGDAQPFAKKNASHGAFYTGFFKGMVSALQGIQILVTSKVLRAKFWQLIGPIRNAQIAYAGTGILLFLLCRDPADDISELFWTMSRWARIVTVLTSFILETQSDATTQMFFAALKHREPEFGALLESREKSKTTVREKLSNLKRAAKLTLFKLAGAIIELIIPGGKHVALPMVKFVSLRPVLGSPMAATISSIHAIPSDILDSSHFDDVLVSFGEAIVDADEMGEEAANEYTKRLESQEMRNYFFKRYRGYLAGCGFVYSLLSCIPFLGVPLTMVSQCGAACVITNIVRSNISKRFRKPLIGEEALTRPKSS